MPSAWAAESPLRQVHADRHRDLRGHHADPVQEDLERGAGEQLGRDVRVVRIVPAVVVDLENRWVLETRYGAGLARKAHAGLLGSAQMRMHDLHRDPAVQTRIARAIDRGHAAMADLVRDVVAVDAREHGVSRGSVTRWPSLYTTWGRRQQIWKQTGSRRPASGDVLLPCASKRLPLRAGRRIRRAWRRWRRAPWRGSRWSASAGGLRWLHASMD